MPELSIRTCDRNGAESDTTTLAWAAKTTVLNAVLQSNVSASLRLVHSSPITSISLFNTGSDAWCVHNLRADGELLVGAAGVWLDNPVSASTAYARFAAHGWYTWRVSTPRRSLKFSFTTCDLSGAGDPSVIRRLDVSQFLSTPS